jgi:endonuclease III
MRYGRYARVYPRPSLRWAAKLPNERRLTRACVPSSPNFSQHLHLRQNKRFATPVSPVLSSQTKGEVTDVAVDKLHAALGGILGLEVLLSA